MAIHDRARVEIATSSPRLTRVALGLFASVGVACSGGGGAGTTGTTAPKVVPTVEDLTIDGGEVALTGIRFVPDAIVPPSMLLVHGRKASLDRLRGGWAKAQGDRKITPAKRALEAQLLATVLFEAARADAGRRTELLTEARAVLAASHATTKGATDETTLVMAAALALGVADSAGADPYLAELISRFGERPGGAMARAQLAFARLGSGDDAVAAALVAGAEPTAAQPELAYVIAWSRFRTGDGPGAAAAITVAAQNWIAEPSRVAVERDFLIMHARSGQPLEVPVAAVAAVTDDPNHRHALLYQLSTAYAFAGRPDEAAAALDASVAVLPAPPADLMPSIRLLQAEYARRAGRVDDLAPAWRSAQTAMTACKACGADDRKTLGDGIAERAVELHTIYATAGDARYRAGAEALYALFATLPDVAARADHAAVMQYAADFAKTQPPVDGSQYDDAIKAPLGVRRQEVLACYEATLQGAPGIGGAVALTIEVDAAGTVAGATTQPPGGTEGLAAVATCIETRARTWRLPSRPRPGTARVTLRYVLGAKP